MSLRAYYEKHMADISQEVVIVAGKSQLAIMAAINLSCRESDTEETPALAGEFLA